MRKNRIISVGFLANVAEWYDFSIYAYLAPTIGLLFLNSNQPKVALIRAFFWFTISYVARPIGSLFWGYYGDCYGRKLALKICLVFMAIPTFLIGILPTYGQVGIIASIFLIILRLIQGFAAGGELPISACYVYEISPLEKKNFFCSIVAASPMLGVLLGSITTFLIYTLFSQKELIDYAWRIPFLLGILVFLFIWYIRNGIDESSEFQAIVSFKKNSFKEYLCSVCSLTNLIRMFQIIILYMFIQSSFYLLFLWMPSYLNIFLSITKNVSFLSNIIGISALVGFTIIVGYFANAKLYKKIIIFSSLAITISVFPLFILLQSKNFFIIILVQIFFAICLGSIDGIIVNILASNFSTETRCSNINIAFTLPSAVFGGFLPTLCSYLIYKTNINLIPVFVLIITGLLTLPIALKSKF